jgi:SAM-dependent methyltransferase
VISVSRIRKGVRLLKCKTLGQPLDPELARDVEVWKLRMRVWHSVVTRKPLDVRLHHEFNLWAAKGVGEGMNDPHKKLVDDALPKMGLAPKDRVLDVACGAGMSSRQIANVVGGDGFVMGMDISNGMLSHARKQSAAFPNLHFVCASAERFPLPDNFFTKAFSVEAFYYFEHQDRVLKEFYRVLAPEGRLFLLICLYRDHEVSLATVDDVDVPVHVRSIEEYKTMLKDGGWADVQAEEFVYEPKPGRKPGVHDRALLLGARKPEAVA